MVTKQRIRLALGTAVLGVMRHPSLLTLAAGWAVARREVAPPSVSGSQDVDPRRRDHVTVLVRGDGLDAAVSRTGAIRPNKINASEAFRRMSACWLHPSTDPDATGLVSGTEGNGRTM
jgi:hypothetical protein